MNKEEAFEKCYKTDPRGECLDMHSFESAWNIQQAKIDKLEKTVELALKYFNQNNPTISLTRSVEKMLREALNKESV